MASDYNSQLISKLYQGKNIADIDDILEEIIDIADPVFIYPLFDAYKKYKGQFFDHYFLSALGGIKSPDSLTIALQIIRDPSISYKNIPWALSLIEKQDYFEKDILKIAEDYLENAYQLTLKKEDELSSYHLSSILDYLKKADVIQEQVHLLRNIFQNDQFKDRCRKVALDYLLNINTKDQLTYIIESYDEKIKNTKAEIILSTELIRWKGGLIEKLKELIEKDGQNRAQEIIKRAKKEKEKKEKSQEQKEANQYANAKIIIEGIYSSLEKINLLSQSNQNIKFPIFANTGSLIKQIKIADSKESLKSNCIELRSLMYNISKKTINHGLEEEEKTELLPEIEEEHYNKPINRLFFFLHSVNVNVDPSVFGLRKLNRAINLLGAHPEEEKELIKILKELDLLKEYSNGEWSKVHKKILDLLKESLLEFKKAILETNGKK